MTGSPTKSQILKDVASVLENRLGVVSAADLERETRFFADLGLASIDAVVLGEAVQDHYQRPLPFNLLMAEIGGRADRDLAIGELVDFIDHHLNTV